MNSSSFQNTLIASINKLSVNGGNPVTENVDYPASNNKSNNPMYKILDQSGNIVGTVANGVFTLGQKTVNTGIEVGKGAVDITKNTLNTGLGITREGLLAMKDTVNTGLDTTYSLGKTGLDTTYNGLRTVGTGSYNVVSDIGKTGFDVTSNTVNGLNSIAHDSINHAGQMSSGLTHDLKKVGSSIIDNGSKGFNNLTSNLKNVSDSAIQGVTGIGQHSLNTVVDLTHDVVSGTLDVGSKIIDTGVNAGNHVINTGKDILNNTFNTGANIVNDIGKTSYNVGDETLKTGRRLSSGLLNGIDDVTNTGIDSTKKLINVGQSRFNNSGNLISSGVNDVKDNLNNTGSNIKHVILKGGNQQELQHSISGGSTVSGVSVLNLNNDSSRMLIPTNFLTSKHVYFVRYNSEGTNLYNFKLQMKGGRVNFLKQVDVTPVWQTNNFTDSAPDGMLIEGKQILNNLISDLKTTQFGGIINERMMDKDSYYNEYKNYKLRYLEMKNN